MAAYDVIVIGTGGVGSAAACHLARRGARVLGIDRFPGGHDRGSSHGQTRIIRTAYFEHPDYVPLLRRAYELWRALEHASGKRLYAEVGLLEAGPANGVVVPGVLASAQQHQLAVERLSPRQANERYPGFSIPADWDVVFEKEAGLLFVELCVLAHLDAAQRAGVQLLVGPSVVNWSVEHNSVAVRTEHDTYHAGRLVITAGAWARQLLANLGVPLAIRRKHLHWYKTRNHVYRDDCPTYLFETPAGFFYGFPQVDERGVKVAEHSGGTVIEDPLADDRSIEPRDQGRVETFLREHLPQVSLQPTDHAVCYYTMSPDEHFIVDRHPDFPEQVCFTAGLSGHGFKFTSVLGEIMADLALTGSTNHPIHFLNCQRWRNAS